MLSRSRGMRIGLHLTFSEGRIKVSALNQSVTILARKTEGVIKEIKCKSGY